VLAAEERAIVCCVPGAEWKQIHLASAVDMVGGLVDLGVMCGAPALNKLRLAMMAMMAMITMTMKMITKTAIEDNSAQRQQPCCGGGGGENEEE